MKRYYIEKKLWEASKTEEVGLAGTWDTNSLVPSFPTKT